MEGEDQERERAYPMTTRLFSRFSFELVKPSISCMNSARENTICNQLSHLVRQSGRESRWERPDSPTNVSLRALFPGPSDRLENIESSSSTKMIQGESRRATLKTALTIFSDSPKYLSYRPIRWSNRIRMSTAIKSWEEYE
jgi:hypothetical protein